VPCAVVHNFRKFSDIPRNPGVQPSLSEVPGATERVPGRRNGRCPVGRGVAAGRRA